jgi:hypothetical protein
LTSHRKTGASRRGNRRLSKRLVARFSVVTAHLFPVVFVSKAELHEIYATKVVLAPAFSARDFEKKWQFVHDSLRDALSIRWCEDCCGGADFAVGDDWSLTWCQCGAVNSPRICCPDYAATILGVLEKMPDSDKWAYSTAVENGAGHEDFPLPPLASGEFVLKAGRMYVPRDELDYSRFFSPTPSEGTAAPRH